MNSRTFSIKKYVGRRGVPVIRQKKEKSLRYDFDLAPGPSRGGPGWNANSGFLSGPNQVSAAWNVAEEAENGVASVTPFMISCTLPEDFRAPVRRLCR